jgi:hypothetical protein
MLLHKTFWRPERRWSSTAMNPTDIGSDVDWITCVRIRQVAGFCEHGHETSDFTKDAAPCSQSVDRSVSNLRSSHSQNHAQWKSLLWQRYVVIDQGIAFRFQGKDKDCFHYRFPTSAKVYSGKELEGDQPPPRLLATRLRMYGVVHPLTKCPIGVLRHQTQSNIPHTAGCQAHRC